MKKIQFYLALTLFVIATSCTNSQNFKSVDVSEFKSSIEKTNDAQILDVRTPGEFAGGHISNAINIDWNGNDFDSQISQLNKEKQIFSQPQFR